MGLYDTWQRLQLPLKQGGADFMFLGRIIPKLRHW